jgi:hypothetical protein
MKGVDYMFNNLSNSLSAQSSNNPSFLFNNPSNYRRVLTDVKSFIKVLDRKLKDIALSLIDPNADMDLGWIKFSAAEKKTNASAVYYAVSVHTTNIESSSKIVTNLRDKMFSIEKDAQKMLSGF